ncbi:MAG: arsenic efflux protein [Bacteroidales bacterium]|jgi:hypothetical protein|nr:arsenic efflux protein [Bacteroidales bacterium]NLH23272.1 arsenic efflux protein [Bacteroidales bacterium]HPJ82380.1 putative manganese transporter [Bacteroidales bacterium]
MWLTEVIKQSVFITGLVMVMMILIEYINVTSKGTALRRLQNRPALQILISALLGIIPGCSGGFVVVSLYAHNLVSFGALIAMMIATVGDEAFLMLAMIPETSLLLFAILFVLALISGFLTDRFIRRISGPFSPEHFAVHKEEQGKQEEFQIWGSLSHNFKPLRWRRLVLFLGLALFAASVVFGFLEHEHHSHGQDQDLIFSERWLNLVFAGLSLLTLVFTMFATDHFVEEHIWDHIVKHHFLKIFFWTFGTLLVIHFLMNNIDLNDWIREQFWIVLPVAILIGMIPASGPHIIFITLYASGSIPLSILLANSIVQEGHAGLPLLAETKKGFFVSKALKIILAVAAAAATRLIYSL